LYSLWHSLHAGTVIRFARIDGANRHFGGTWSRVVPGRRPQ
jgi:hypothetical protein